MYDTDIKKELAERASGRYRKCLEEIDRIKNGIYRNRKGQIPLAEITPNQEKLNLRIEREGMPANMALERINGVPNFQDVFILEKIMQLSQTVCRIIINTQSGASGYGTGFLIAPNLLITNNHVLPNAATARLASAQFNYQLGINRRAQQTINIHLCPDRFFMTSSLEPDASDPYSGLDFTIVAVAEKSEEGIPVASLGFARLDEGLGKVLEGENCVVIQHPGGDFKKVVLRDIRMISLVENFLIYESDTLPGSSGSMVLGLGTGEVVALHHSGVPRRDAQGRWLRKNGSPVQPGDSDEVIDWIGNEGVRISSIIKAIRNMALSQQMEPLRQQLLQQVKAPVEALTQVADFNTKTAQPQTAAIPISAEQDLYYFYVKLVDHAALIEDWQQNAALFFPEIQLNKPVFPNTTASPHKLIFEVAVKPERQIQAVIADLKALPHVHTATPYLLKKATRSAQKSAATFRNHQAVPPTTIHSNQYPTA